MVFKNNLFILPLDTLLHNLPQQFLCDGEAVLNVQSQNDSCWCTKKCFNGRLHFKATVFFRFECVNLISELSIYMYAHVERNQKVCASSKKKKKKKSVSPWALKRCTQHNCNCLKPIPPCAIETVIIGKRACWRLYCHCVETRQSMRHVYLYR